MEAPEIEAVAIELMQDHDDISWLQGYEIAYLWKALGGRSGGRAKLGACHLASGLVKHFSQVDWIIWIAADYAVHLTPYQIEALVYHELLHCDVDIHGDPAIQGHDIEAFTMEVLNYGVWKGDLFTLAAAFRQVETSGALMQIR